MEEQGFFVKIEDKKYQGPFTSLNQARAEARVIGPDLLIYHGILKKTDDETIDDSQLFLVPKLKKEAK